MDWLEGADFLTRTPSHCRCPTPSEPIALHQATRRRWRTQARASHSPQTANGAAERRWKYAETVPSRALHFFQGRALGGSHCVSIFLSFCFKRARAFRWACWAEVHDWFGPRPAGRLRLWLGHRLNKFHPKVMPVDKSVNIIWEHS
jgi:hypothetical protein